MKKFKNKLKQVSIVSILVFALVLGFVSPNTTNAALAPGFLGGASTYSVYGAAGITGGAAATVWGDVGENNTGDTSINGQQAGTYHAEDQSATIGANITSAHTALGLETLTQIGILDLDIPNTIGPGVYDVGTGATFSAALTLIGAGTYVFKGASSISQTTGGTMTLTGGACASSVYWYAGSGAMTFAGAGNIEGTIIANTTITFANSALTLKGRALARTAAVALGGITITEPVACAIASSGAGEGTINVVKTVVNDSGGTKTVADFPLFVNGTSVTSGVTKTFAAGGTYTVTETTDPNYTRTFSGDCDVNGRFNLNKFDNKFCIITNNDIGAPLPVVPPLIDVVKVPSPLALPLGPGPVLYTYTLRNIGTVPVTNITMVGDTCSPIVRISGDVNGDNKLDLNEVWVHTCSTTLQATHTNTVVATGWANSISAVDIASATVVVGVPIVPPLIHITKVPNPLALLSGAGFVTYTNKVTNPGIVALSNVSVTDDKCSPVNFISGDINNDSKLDISETWTYTCRVRLTATTTNTVIAAGTANGLTARDFAIATVVVTFPSLPQTGFPPETLNVIIPVGILFVLLSFYLVHRKQVI